MSYIGHYYCGFFIYTIELINGVLFIVNLKMNNLRYERLSKIKVSILYIKTFKTISTKI